MIMKAIPTLAFSICLTYLFCIADFSGKFSTIYLMLILSGFICYGVYKRKCWWIMAHGPALSDPEYACQPATPTTAHIHRNRIAPVPHQAASCTHSHDIVLELVTIMRPLTIASAVLAAGSSSLLVGVAAQTQTAQIYIQLLGSSSASPAPLAEITYDLSNSGSEGPSAEYPLAQVTSYEAPDLDPETTSSSSLARIGLYDPARKEWIGATSAASVENFGKGYSPHFLVNVAPATTEGESGKAIPPLLLGASLKGVRIDAGQTRDFGPQVKLVVASRGKQPELNRPVVLSPEGKKVGEKEEKSFLQKSVLFPCCCLCHLCPNLHTANLPSQILVDDWYRSTACYGRRRRGQIELYSIECEWREPACIFRGTMRFSMS